MASVQLERGVAGGEEEESSHSTEPESLEEEELGGVANIKQLKQFRKEPSPHLTLLGTGRKQTLHPTPQLAQFLSGLWLYKYLSLRLPLW